jgi:hypothetical protein
MSQTDVKVISRVTRLAGAILAETNGEYYLVGQLKEPCDFSAHGFERLEESDPGHPVQYKKLKIIGDVVVDKGEYLEMETQGEDLARLLFKRLVILRNYSVSDRLWSVVTVEKNRDGKVDARWLEQMPDDVWEIVRENILKCK